MEKNSSLLRLRKQYIAAMTREMKCPLEKIITLVAGSETAIAARSGEIKDAARYLLSLVDELSSFAGPLNKTKP